MASTSAQHGLHSNWVLRVPRVPDGGEHKALPDCANQSGGKKCTKSGSTSSRLRLQRNPIHLPKVVESALQTLRFRPRLKKHWGTFETNKSILIHLLLAYLSVLWRKLWFIYESSQLPWPMSNASTWAFQQNRTREVSFRSEESRIFRDIGTSLTVNTLHTITMGCKRGRFRTRFLNNVLLIIAKGKTTCKAIT